MHERLAWLESRRTNPEYFGPILAAIAHFEVTEVHPFADYNGRTARLFAVAVFLREEVAPRALFSPSATTPRIAMPIPLPYATSSRRERSTPGSSYYVTGLASELSRVAERVDDSTASAARSEAPSS